MTLTKCSGRILFAFQVRVWDRRYRDVRVRCDVRHKEFLTQHIWLPKKKCKLKQTNKEKDKVSKPPSFTERTSESEAVMASVWRHAWHRVPDDIQRAHERMGVRERSGGVIGLGGIAGSVISSPDLSGRAGTRSAHPNLRRETKHRTVSFLQTACNPA